MGAKGAKIRDSWNMWKRYSPHNLWCNLQSSTYTRTSVLQKFFLTLSFLTSDSSRPCQFCMTLFDGYGAWLWPPVLPHMHI